ncbi:MAG TPA: hypothetical protein VFR58_00905 [Flavisolibacter sp.]|nr:hypothetical protein [Flavisolibacter sp.]
METKTSFRQAHLDHQLWINELEFFREEINIFENQLDGLREKERDGEKIDRADFFQNQFARYRDLCNSLESEVLEAEKLMAIYAGSEESQDLDNVRIADHAQFRERMDSFRSDYLSLKDEFRRSNW